jgi:hypothetical protein
MSTERDEIELLTVRPEDTHNFRIGTLVVQESTDGGLTWRTLTGWRLRAYHVRQWLHRMTRWWRPRIVVAAIDKSEGSITMVMERWAWRRWRWERQWERQ